jgi:hypothetical protein
MWPSSGFHQLRGCYETVRPFVRSSTLTHLNFGLGSENVELAKGKRSRFLESSTISFAGVCLPSSPC